MTTSKRVLVLGAGLVTRPMVSYLLEQPDISLTVATRTVAKAEALVAGHARGRAVALDVADEAALRAIVGEHDLVVSLLPYIHHVKVAKLCIEHGKPLVTTSYVSDAMRALDARGAEGRRAPAQRDRPRPGIDHMSAMRIIHGVPGAGGKVTGFVSYCGGLPAPEANTTPWATSSSWSPRGVVLAGRNAARYLWEGDLREVPGPDLFGDVHHLTVRGPRPARGLPQSRQPGLPGDLRPGAGEDDLPRHLPLPRPLRGLEGPGRLRLAGHPPASGEPASATPSSSARWSAARAASRARPRRASWTSAPRPTCWIASSGWASSATKRFPAPPSRAPWTCWPSAPAQAALRRRRAGHDRAPAPGDGGVPAGPHRAHRLHARGLRQPGGDSAMSRTVSLPAAIAVRRILDGTIRETGVQVPVLPGIYDPVLDELETLGDCVQGDGDALGPLPLLEQHQLLGADQALVADRRAR